MICCAGKPRVCVAFTPTETAGAGAITNLLNETATSIALPGDKVRAAEQKLQFKSTLPF
jgi:hypothetical protein